MRYWIGVACKEHVLRGVTGGFCQVCHGKAAPLNRMRAGDWLLYYSPTLRMGDAHKYQAFTAIGLTRSAALELAEHNIRVCAIAPGYVASPRILDSGPETVDCMAASHPMKRLAKPEEVAHLAHLVAYLASERAAFITGSVRSIDGGYTAQ